VANIPNVAQHQVAEIRLGAERLDDEYLTADVLFEDPEKRRRLVPAFLSGGEWRVRYASDVVGEHRYFAKLSNGRLLERPEGVVNVVRRDGRGVLDKGPLRVASGRRHLEHSDGSPFLWLADTWWHGLTRRVSHAEFGDLAETRAAQGFSVIQLVAGLYPEAAPFGQEGMSNSGWVWRDNFAGPNLDWFDEADARITMLVDSGLMPCIVGGWAYYLRLMEISQTLRHWREMIARWGAHPVVWCLVGEPVGLNYDEHTAGIEDQYHEVSTAEDTYKALAAICARRDPAVAEQLKRLNSVARGVRKLEPFGRPITIHSVPSQRPWEFLDDEDLVDFWLLQTGHGGANSIEPSVNAVIDAQAHEPRKPVINGEACYEGIAGSSWQEIQRFLFWSHMLSGTGGHSYGAHGLWGFNTEEYTGGYSGRAPHWKEAAALPGATQVGRGKSLLDDLPWSEFESHSEWIDPHQDKRDRCLPYAAGIADRIRLFYIPATALVRNHFALQIIRLRKLGAKEWRARLIDPRTGYADPDFRISPEGDGTALLRQGYQGLWPLPSWEDWLLILEPA
jgi:hypothetical protein